MRYFIVVLCLSMASYSGNITFEKILKQAVGHNLGLEIIQTNKTITEAKIDEINALYYPTLSLALSTQYTKGLGEDTGNTITIGGSTENSQTQYEASLALKLGYRLYDFGVRSTQKAIAQIDREMVEFDLAKSKQELKLSLLELYTQVMTSKRKLQYYRKIARLQKKIHSHMKRLHKAGQIGKTEVVSEKIALASITNQIKQINTTLRESVNQINYYTGRHYTPRSRFEPLRISKYARQKYLKSRQYKSWSRKIDKKRKEIELLHNQQYPAIDFYANYNFYGSAKCQIGCAFENMEPSHYVIGVRASVALFDGFKSEATERKLRAEEEQLRLQRLQSQREYQQKQREIAHNAQYIGEEIGLYEEMIGYQEQKLHMQKRLLKNKEITAIVKLKDEIAILYKKLELAVKKAVRASKLKEMEIHNAS